MTRLLSIISLLALCAAATVRAGDLPDAPFGWAACESSVGWAPYSLKGGGEGSVAVLRASGADMAEEVARAIADYDVVILDGSAGDFVFSSRAILNGLSHKTIVGINGARLRTEFRVTDQIRRLLDELGVGSLSGNSADGGGGTLPNGQYVAEEREYNIRLALIDLYGSDKEPYRKAGIFEMDGCSDIVVRNLELAGPGSLDVGGSDLITVSGCRHVWVDHCHLHDGLDGNMDIITGSDLITVSSCVFDYTSLSYDHPLSNLVRGTEGVDEGGLNITWAYCRWGHGCGARLPWAQFGTNHVFSCHYDCPGSNCVQGSAGTRLRVEECWFDPAVKKVYNDAGGTAALVWTANIHPGHAAPRQHGSVEIGYPYRPIAAADVPAALAEAGPMLQAPIRRPLTCLPGKVDLGAVYTGTEICRTLNISCIGGDVSRCTVEATEGITLSADGEHFGSTLTLEASGGIINSDVIVQALPQQAGLFSGTVTLTTDDSRLSVPVSGEALPLGDFIAEASVTWPFDSGEGAPTDCRPVPAEAFAACSAAIGDALYIKGTVTPNGGTTMTRLNPHAALPRQRVEDARVTCTVAVADDYVFIPEALQFDACRVGTDMSAIDVEVSRGPEAPLQLLCGAQPERSSTSGQGYTRYRLDLRDLPLQGRTIEADIYIYYLSENKQVALGGITLSGRLYRVASSVAAVAADADTTAYYTLQGIRVNRPLPGRVYIRVGSTGASKIVY